VNKTAEVTTQENFGKGSLDQEQTIPQKAPPYRWVVLVLFALNGMFTQVYWLNFAAIRLDAATLYNVPPTYIDLLSSIFMIVYLVTGPISSLIIDGRGFKIGTSIGVILNGGFAFLRVFAVGPGSFWLLLIFQAGVAAGQPFMYNAISKLCARWFPPAERATASGLANLGFFIGMLLSFLFSPILFLLPGVGLQGMLLVFGIGGLAIAILFVILVKDHPTIPYGDTRRLTMTEMMHYSKLLFRNRFALVHAVLGFIGIGFFNMVFTEIQNITAVPNVSPDDAGQLGAVALISGIIGLLLLPALSDHLFKAGKSYARKLFMVLSFTVATPTMVMVGFVSDLTTAYVLMAILGFFLLSSFAIAMQWVAEGTAPIPESQSNNLLMYMGQIGGIILIWLVPTLFNSGTIINPMYNNSMYLGAAFMAICLFLIFVFLKDKKR